MLQVEKIRTPDSLANHSYEAIKERLLDLDLSDPSVEERIDERSLAKQLGVSRTPLREALIARDGGIRALPAEDVSCADCPSIRRRRRRSTAGSGFFAGVSV